MAERKSKTELLPPEVIIAAVEGDAQAVLQVLNHYEKLIDHKLNKWVERLDLNPTFVPLEDMKQEVLILLILAMKKIRL